VCAAFGGFADAWAAERGWRGRPASDEWTAILDAHYAPTSKGAHARAAVRDAIGGDGRAAAAWAGRLEAVAWHWYATLTYRELVHPEAAESGARQWLSDLAAHARRPLAWVLAWELQRRGVLHAHLLLVGVPRRWIIGGDCRLAAMRMWERLHRNHGFARVEAFEPDLGAGGYLGKYVAKGGAVDVGVARPSLMLRAAGRRRGGRRNRRAARDMHGGIDVVRCLARR